MAENHCMTPTRENHTEHEPAAKVQQEELGFEASAYRKGKSGATAIQIRHRKLKTKAEQGSAKIKARNNRA
jgi:hypothetical protein